jgi:hypothetical protein
MTNRNYIEEILAIKDRQATSPNRWGKISARISRLNKVLSLLNLLEFNSDLVNLVEQHEDLSWHWGDFYDVRFEVARYIPIGFVACIEGYFHLAYADLINHGSPYRDNLTKFKDIKFDLDQALKLERHAVSLGDFVSHLLPVKNLEEINVNMSLLMGSDFLERFKETRPKLDTMPGLFSTPEEITNHRIAALKKLFELRHMFAHEADPYPQENFSPYCRGLAEAAVEFLWVSEAIMDELLR